MLATHTTTGMELFLPPMVRFHDTSDQGALNRLRYAPALSFAQQTTAQQAIDALRQMPPEVDTIYYLFVTDYNDRLVGVVSLRQLLRAAPGARLFEFMDQRLLTLPHNATLEEQAHLMSESGLLALPVVDEKGRLVGAMDAGDLIRAAQRDATAQMYHLAGVSQTEPVAQPAVASMGYRSLWLLASLAVAVLMAGVVGLFENVIHNIAVLAVFMPLVMRQGGQAGIQTLTRTVRSLALGQIHRQNTCLAVQYELGTGLLNALLMGGLTGLIGGFWQGQVVPGLVVGVSVGVTILLASLAGASVPLICKMLHIDPSRVSSLAVGTIVELCGLTCLLGLGALWL